MLQHLGHIGFLVVAPFYSCTFLVSPIKLYDYGDQVHQHFWSIELNTSLCVSQAKIEMLVTAMGGVLHPKASLDVSFVIVKNVLAAKYKVWYLNIVLRFGTCFL